jgi:hypothetical protein
VTRTELTLERRGIPACCRFSCRLIPAFSGIAKGEQRQITPSVNDLAISSRTFIPLLSPDKREVGSSTLPRPITFNEGRHAKRPPAEADGLSTQQVK